MRGEGGPNANGLNGCWGANLLPLPGRVRGVGCWGPPPVSGLTGTVLRLPGRAGGGGPASGSNGLGSL